MVPLECLLSTNVSFWDEMLKYVPLLIVFIILLMLSAFFSCCETALSTSNIIRLKGYVEEKRRGAKKALYLAEKFDSTLITLLVGNNIVNIGATTIAAYILSQVIANPSIYNIVNTFGMTIIVLIFGEITPKSLAKENPEKIALRFSGVLFIIHKIYFSYN